MNKSTHVFHSTLIPPIKRMELWGFISFRIWLAEEFWWEWGILENFSLSCSKRALTSASVRY